MSRPQTKEIDLILAEMMRRGLSIPIAAQPETPRFVANPMRLVRGMLDAIKPRPRMLLSEYAEQYHMLSSLSAAPGKYDLRNTPYWREVLDALSPSSGIQKVTLSKGSQIGASELAYILISYLIAMDPCSMLLVNPTDDTMLVNSETRVDPMIEANPQVKANVAKLKSRSTQNRKLFKSGIGFFLRMAGANSPNPLSSTPVEKVVLDEIDRYPRNLKGEGSPLQLAEARTRTFGDQKKIFILSTPTDSASMIDELYEKTEKRMYHVPCPHCHELQVLDWENFRYEKLENGTYHCAAYCIHCAAAIEEQHKPWMFAEENGAKWIALNPERELPTERGYHLSGLYSWVGSLSWAQIAKIHDDAFHITNNQNDQITFDNTILGKIHTANEEAPSWQTLKDRSGAYPRNKLPAQGPMFITAGADVQRDRIEVEVVAWGFGKTSWSVDYRVFHGNPADPADACWLQIEALMAETWICSGVQMPIAWLGLDTSNETLILYAKTDELNNKGLRILPLKGVDTQDMPLAQGQGQKLDALGKKIGRPLWLVGVSKLKSELYGFLSLKPTTDNTATTSTSGTTTIPNGYCHFPDYGEEYFKGLTAEARVVVMDKNGYPKEVWKKTQPRNEPLDCRNYARAVAHFNRMLDYNEQDMSILRGQLSTIHQPKTTKPKPKPKSSAWDGVKQDIWK